MAKQPDEENVLTERAFSKLQDFARLLARQAAREELGHSLTRAATPFGGAPILPVVLSTATCT